MEKERENRAQEFCLSERARDSDFSTNPEERGVFLMRESQPASVNHLVSPHRTRKVRGCLIAQFGGHSPLYMAHAAALVKKHVDFLLALECTLPAQKCFRTDLPISLGCYEAMLTE